MSRDIDWDDSIGGGESLEETSDEIRAASRECELEEWRAVNHYCGKCGAPMRFEIV